MTRRRAAVGAGAAIAGLTITAGTLAACALAPSPSPPSVEHMVERVVAPGPRQRRETDGGGDRIAPEVERLLGTLSARQVLLQPLLDAGYAGLTNAGLITLRDAAAVPVAERVDWNALVATENADRLLLVQAAARRAGETEARMQAAFAATWLAQLRAGWYYQTDAGEWRQARD